MYEPCHFYKNVNKIKKFAIFEDEATSASAGFQVLTTDSVEIYSYARKGKMCTCLQKNTNLKI